MTAVIGILREKCAVVAADSAVTITRDAHSKINNSANKMIRLSENDPICVMITGAGGFFYTPWDIIVRRYRQTLGDRRFDTVKEHAEDFFRFLGQNDKFFPERTSANCLNCDLIRLFLYCLSNIWFDKITMAHSGAVDNLHVFRNSLRKIIQESNKLGRFPMFVDYDFDEFSGKVDRLMRSISSVVKDEGFPSYELRMFWRNLMSERKKNYSFPDEPIKELWTEIASLLKKDVEPFKNGKTLRTELKEALFATLTSNRRFHDRHATLVFVGYGKKEDSPSLAAADVYNGFDKKVCYRFKEENLVSITEDNPVAICPFAQDDIIHSFLDGTNTKTSSYRFVDYFRDELKESHKRFPEMSDSKLAIEEASIPIMRELGRYISQQVRMNNEEWKKIILESEPTEIAAMAKNLIEMTNFNRYLTFRDEGVGGLVDLAVITKTDGFIWLNRKNRYGAIDMGDKTHNL